MTRLQALLLRTAVAARMGFSERELMDQVDRAWIRICEEASEVRVFAGEA